MNATLLKIINEIRAHKGLDVLTDLSPETNLSRHLSFDSFDLAELTVRIEDKFQIDIFEKGIVVTIGDILDVLEGK